MINRPFGFRAQPICSMPLAKHEARIGWIRQMFAELVTQHPGLLIYDPNPLLCPGGVCNVMMNGMPLYPDESHFSDYGAGLVAQDFLDWLHAHQSHLRSASGSS